VPLEFNAKGDLVSEILPCGCDYEVISEKVLMFYVSNEDSVAQHARDVAGREGSFCMFFHELFDISEILLTTSLA
jgi:hypothetical protein